MSRSRPIVNKWSVAFLAVAIVVVGAVFVARDVAASSLLPGGEVHAPSQAWNVLLTEDFEGVFPGTKWRVTSSDTTVGWGKRQCRAMEGASSAWAHGGGTQGVTYACGSDYPDDLVTWMIHGPLSLVGATAAEIQFDAWLQTEDDFDLLNVYVSTDGETYYGWKMSGDSDGWVHADVDVAESGVPGGVLGQPEVWVAFRFISDDSLGFEGVHVDNVEVRASGGAPPPATDTPGPGPTRVPTRVATLPPSGPGTLYLPVLQRSRYKPQDLGQLLGTVHDMEGNPLGGATIAAAGQRALTNGQGYFSLADLTPSSRVVVKVRKAGYVGASHIVTVRTKDGTFLEVTMARVEHEAQISGSSGGTVSTATGGVVTVPPGSLVEPSGRPFSGSAVVSVTTFDPTTESGRNAFPGEFEGVARSGETIPIVSYGFMDVQLATPDGRRLNLAPGRTATIRIPIPAGLRGSAPASMPLWYYDEDEGTWYEDAVGTKDGDAYTGQVGHFTVWNNDVGNNPAYVVGRVIDCQTGTPIEGARVTIKGISPRNCWDSGERSTTPAGAFPNDSRYVGIPVDPNAVCEIWAERGGIKSLPTRFTSPGTGQVFTHPDICLNPPGVRTTLTWGQDPEDLDAHLTVPMSGRPREHVYFDRKTPPNAGANLDTDDQDGGGPEIITIYDLHDGIYRYSVHHFDGAGTISASNAIVTMVIDRGPVAGLYSLRPPAGATGKQDLWMAWDLHVNSGVVTSLREVRQYHHNVDDINHPGFQP